MCTIYRPYLITHRVRHAYVCVNIYRELRIHLYYKSIRGLRRKNWRGGFREYYFGKNISLGITKPIPNPGKN